MLDREGWLDISVNFVPLAIIALFLVSLLLYNPWGWDDPLVMAVTIALHLVPILVLAPVSYLFVTVYVEADDGGTSETAARLVRRFSLESGNAGQQGESGRRDSEG